MFEALTPTRVSRATLKHCVCPFLQPVGIIIRIRLQHIVQRIHIAHQRPPPLLHPDETLRKCEQVAIHARLVEYWWECGCQNLFVNFHQYASFLESAAVDESIVNRNRWDWGVVYKIVNLNKLLQALHGWVGASRRHGQKVL